MLHILSHVKRENEAVYNCFLIGVKSINLNKDPIQMNTDASLSPVLLNYVKIILPHFSPTAASYSCG